MQFACLERIPELESRLGQLSGEDVAALLEPLRAQLLEPLPPEASSELIPAALALCRRLFAQGRSGDAIPLARAALSQATLAGDVALVRRATTACGVLLGDVADIVGAIEHHAHAMRLATEAHDALDEGRAWNNLGLAFAVANNYELALRCNQRAVAAVEALEGPVYLRYAACANAANGLFQLGQYDEGLRQARRALAELTPEFLKEDPYSGILLRRNFTYLLLARGELDEARIHADEVLRMAQGVDSPRAQIAASTTRAAYEIATGHHDIALTRLDQALARAREVPGVLRDTLACVIRSEEAAGQPDRALLRLKELADHDYHAAIDRARRIVALGEGPALGPEREMRRAKARLVAQLEPRDAPEGWEVLRRVAIGAALRADPTGWHGMRVGSLCRGLATEHGCAPLEALEIGLAAELHDIGFASVPGRILSKAGEPNAVERSLIRRHTDAGAEILRDDRAPRMLLARDIARYHHARWDGTGHPERVGGPFIPLAARMCAIADAYDDLVNPANGTRAQPMATALRTLQASAGGGYDPALLAEFGTMIKKQSREPAHEAAADHGLEEFQDLLASLDEDRGFA